MDRYLASYTKDASVTFAAKILEIVFHIIASIIIVRTFGPEGQGIYFLAILLPSFLLTTWNFGIAPASIFYIGKRKHNINEIIGSNIILSFFIGICGVLIGILIILFLDNILFRGVSRIYLFLGLILYPLFLFTTFVNYVFLGLQKIKEFNFFNIIQKFIFLLFLATSILAFKFELKAAIGANILSYIFMALVLVLYVKNTIGIFKLKLKIPYVKDAFRYGIKVYVSNIIIFLLLRIDVFLINIFLNPISVGFYSVAVALAEKLWLISQAAGMVLFPKVSSETDEKRIKVFTPFVCRNVLFIASICAVVLFFSSKLIITLFFSSKFLNSVLPLKILLIGIVPMSGWNILSNDLNGRGLPKLNIYVSVTCVIINIILNFLFIPYFGIIGAAWATSISYSIAFFAIVIIYSKISGNFIPKIIFAQREDFYMYRGLVFSLLRRKFQPDKI